jgi:HSP20 family molecular chaperone IbpA
VPPVDIVENDVGITLMADMPGVSKERLGVRVDGDNLLIEGIGRVKVPDQLELLHSEIRNPYFRRSFTLSRELDPSKIEASLRDGVLRLHIPKAESGTTAPRRDQGRLTRPVRKERGRHRRPLLPVALSPQAATAITARSLQHVAGIGIGDQGIGIGLQQEAGRDRIRGRLRHRLHVAGVRAVALLERQARIAGGEALGRVFANGIMPPT